MEWSDREGMLKTKKRLNLNDDDDDSIFIYLFIITHTLPLKSFLNEIKKKRRKEIFVVVE